MLLMSSSLLLQQCPACLVRLIWMVLEMGGWWPYCCCFVGCYLQDFFGIARSILVQFLVSFFSIRLVSPHIYMCVCVCVCVCACANDMTGMDLSYSNKSLPLIEKELTKIWELSDFNEIFSFIY